MLYIVQTMGRINKAITKQEKREPKIKEKGV